MEKIKCLTSFDLKLIALITMTFDHIGAVLLPQYGFLRIIGRIAFPIYAFLIVEGLFYSKDIKKYMFRLFVFALISEMFFDLAFYDSYIYKEHQNVFFTLFIGLITVYFTDIIRKKMYEDNKKQKYLFGSLLIIIFIAGILIADLLRTDYAFYGVFMIYCFYMFRFNFLSQLISVGYINGFMMGGTQTYALLAMPFIYFYNQKPGKYKLKWLFYLYYPLHLIIIFLFSKLN